MKENNLEDLYDLGKELLEQDKLEEALACYDKILELNPNEVRSPSHI